MDAGALDEISAISAADLEWIDVVRAEGVPGGKEAEAKSEVESKFEALAVEAVEVVAVFGEYTSIFIVRKVCSTVTFSVFFGRGIFCV